MHVWVVVDWNFFPSFFFFCGGGGGGWERRLMGDFTTKLPVPSMSDQTTNYHICCCRLKDRVSMHLLLLWRVLNTVKNSGKASYSQSGIRSVSSPVHFFHMTTK